MTSPNQGQNIDSDAQTSTLTESSPVLYDTIRGYYSFMDQTVKSYANEFNNGFQYVNKTGPVWLSDFKKDYVFSVDNCYRNPLHHLITLGYIVGALKFKTGFVYTLRNALVLHFTLGAIFNPENVNPFYRTIQNTIDVQAKISKMPILYLYQKKYDFIYKYGS